MNITGKAYIHGQWRYFVDEREDNGKFTVFMSSTDSTTDGMKAEVATIPDFPTFEEAQNALDGYALKHQFAAECSTPNEGPEMEQQTFGDTPADNDDSVPSADDTPEVEQRNDFPEYENDGDDSEDNSANKDNGNPPSNNNFEESHDEENTKENDISGEPLDLRGNEFDFIVNPANAALNRFVAMLHAKKQHDGEINIKVTFEDNGGSYIFGGAVSGKINLTMKPQKVTGDAVELQFDAQGNPIIPTDREHQLNFDEIQPGQREYSPTGGTAQVDGTTGIVESYEAVQDDSSEKELYPCKNIDCPFYRVPDAGESGCYYYPTKDADTFDVNEAVEENGCTRPEILQAYADAQPQEDDESEDKQL